MKKLMTFIMALIMVFGFMSMTPVHAQKTMELSDEEVSMIERKREWTKKKHEKMIKNMTEKLGINEENAKKLHQLKKEYYAKKKKIKESLNKLDQKKNDIMSSDKFDEGKLSAIFEDMKKLKIEMIDAKKVYKVGLRKHLDANQYNQYKEMKKGKYHNKSKSCCSGKSQSKKCEKCLKMGSMKGSGYDH